MSATVRSRFVKRVRNDPTAWSLLAANLFTLALAAIEAWDLRSLMWIYWTQSVIIGAFNFARILTLRDFRTTGLMQGGRQVPRTQAAKRSVAFFFLAHYGFFHLVYALFLAGTPRPARTTDVSETGLGIGALLLCGAAFLVNHAFSYRHHRECDRTRAPNLGRVMFFPYARILPMHLTGCGTDPTDQPSQLVVRKLVVPD